MTLLGISHGYLLVSEQDQSSDFLRRHNLPTKITLVFHGVPSLEINFQRASSRNAIYIHDLLLFYVGKGVGREGVQSKTRGF